MRATTLSPPQRGAYESVSCLRGSLLILGLSTGLTVVALLLLDWYVWSITTVDDLLLEDRRAFVAFVVSLLLVPIILVVNLLTTK